MKKKEIQTPYYIVYKDKLEANLRLIDRVRRESGADIIMAFKANALWPMFPIIRKYGFGSTASSPNELKLAREYLTDRVHVFSPAYTERNFGTYLKAATHISFNSLGQWEKFRDTLAAFNASHPGREVSVGLRINPKCSVIETDMYNPALPGSRFGVSAEALADGLPEGIDGLHFHALCESNPADLEKVLMAVEEKFPLALSQAKWLNMGGGHLMTEKNYNPDRLIEILKDFKSRHPQLRLILEPGSAFTWQTGDLEVSVVDVVEDGGIRTAIIDASFACHMPDTLEMPYMPVVSQALGMSEESRDGEMAEGKRIFSYRLGGNSCLSGDFIGYWHFDHELHPGDRLTLRDMNHYTTVKTTMFNGLDHPAIVVAENPKAEGAEVIREYGYADYKRRMG